MKHQKKRYFTWEQFDDAVKDLAKQIRKSKVAFNSVYGVPRGGLPLATCLAYRLELPIVFKPEKYTLICDDINDTGTTLKKYTDGNIAVIFSKEQSRVKEQFKYLTVPDTEWVVFPWEGGLKNSKLDRAK